MRENNIINVDAKLEANEVLICKYKLLLNNPFYGFLTAISIVNLVGLIGIFISKGFEGFFQEFSEHFPGTLIGIAFPFFIVFLLVKNYIINRLQFKNIRYLEINYFFSDFGITITFKKEENISWNRIGKVQETKKHFIINKSDDGVLLVPKKDFINNNDIQSLKFLLKEKGHAKKLALKK